MYSAQITKERIKLLCKNNKIVMEQMLSDCSLGVNAIRQINDTKGMASFSLALIADYLNVSVDYLLGRTDIPEINRSTQRNINIFPIDDIRGVTSNIRPAPTKVIAAKGAKGTKGEPKQKPRKTT